MGASDMTALQLLAAAKDVDESQTLGDESPAIEPEPTHVEPYARLRLSVELVKQARRIADLEQRVEDQRRAINRVLARFATEGRPVPTDADVARLHDR